MTSVWSFLAHGTGPHVLWSPQFSAQSDNRVPTSIVCGDAVIDGHGLVGDGLLPIATHRRGHELDSPHVPGLCLQQSSCCITVLEFPVFHATFLHDLDGFSTPTHHSHHRFHFFHRSPTSTPVGFFLDISTTVPKTVLSGTRSPSAGDVTLNLRLHFSLHPLQKPFAATPRRTFPPPIPFCSLKATRGPKIQPREWDSHLPVRPRL